MTFMSSFWSVLNLHIKTFVKFAILSYCKLTQVNYYVQVLKCMVHTVNREIFVLKNFHAIIFRVKIFSYASRPYENILTTKIFQ